MHIVWSIRKSDGQRLVLNVNSNYYIEVVIDKIFKGKVVLIFIEAVFGLRYKKIIDKKQNRANPRAYIKEINVDIIYIENIYLNSHDNMKYQEEIGKFEWSLHSVKM